MCSVHEPAPVPAGFLVEDAAVHEEPVPLEPVDAVAITTVCDNTVDILLMDQGPARRLLGRSGEPSMLTAPTLEEGKVVDAPQAERCLSALVHHLEGSDLLRSHSRFQITNSCRRLL